MKAFKSVIFFSIFLILGMSCVKKEEKTVANENPDIENLIVWTHEFDPFNKALNEKWIPEFEELHPEISIEYEAIPFSGKIVTYNTKVLASLAAGSGPDIWNIGSWNFIEDNYVDLGLVAPLDPEIFGYDSLQDLLNDYPENSHNAFVHGDEIYALVSELSTFCLFYNKSMFENAGIPYPDDDRALSWEDVLKIGSQLTKRNPQSGEIESIGYQFGFFANYHSPQWYSQMFYPFLRQYGMDDFFINGEPAGDREAVVRSLEMFERFTHDEGIYDPYFYKDWFSGFAEDCVGMLLAGPWFVSVIQSINPDVQFGVAPVPVLDPEDRETYKSIIYSFGWAVNSQRSQEKQRFAQEFIAFLNGKKGDIEEPAWWFENTGMMQPRKSFLSSDDYSRMVDSTPWMARFDWIYDNYDLEYYQHSSDDAGAALIRAIDRIIYSKMAPEESAGFFQSELILQQLQN